MTPEQKKRVAEIAAKTCAEFCVNYDGVFFAAEEAILAALADPLLQQENEYICKCGLRVTPHRCKTGEEF